ncbi:MAG: hypothetical protein HYS27_25490 [Deltaproteobacteria bacterium]|nr:hypothetical protein [Deltaproteobacteria bacterium]
MRIVAVDARTIGDEARRVVALALAQAPQRLILFGATGEIAAAQVTRELAQRDERYLDVAARWLLERGQGAPPTRAGIEVPLLEIGQAVRDDQRCAPLPSSDRVIELVGSQLCMAVPDRARVAPEEWDNAALWLAGGEAAAGLHDERGRPVVVPGDAASGAGLAVIDLTANEAKIALLESGGSIAATRTLTLGGGARITVKAAGATRT